MQTLNLKSEADRRKTYKDWHVSFMDKITWLLLDFTTQTRAI